MSRKTLYIIRHAKAMPEGSAPKDFDRELDARGRAEATSVGEGLKEKGFNAQLIVASPASRTRQTADIISRQTGGANITYDETIYNAGLETLLGVVNGWTDDADTIALVGHNPGVTYLAEFLSGEGDLSLPTCGVVKLEFDVDTWADVNDNTGELIWFDHPGHYVPVEK